MDQKRRHKQHQQQRPQEQPHTAEIPAWAPAAATPAQPQAPVAAARDPAARGRRWPGWVANAALALGAPCLFALVLELGLRVAGFGYPTHYLLRSSDGAAWIPNRYYTFQFYPNATATKPHPFRMAVSKPAGTTRILVLGESAAAGTPDPAFGFVRILEAMLEQQFPAHRFEVINAAMRGINSHILLPMARECAHHEVDLVVMYIGNNELIGLHSPSPRGLNLTPYWRVLRAVQFVRGSKLAQVLEPVIEPTPATGPRDSSQDMDHFRAQRLAADDPRRAAVYTNFERNLNAMLRVFHANGTPAVLATVAVNLADCPPLASLPRRDLPAAERHRWQTVYAQGIGAETRGDYDEAARAYERAARIDDHVADLHFRLARVNGALARTNAALEHYRLARDWDALALRADRRINDVIRRVASAHADQGVMLADIEAALGAQPSSRHGAPGEFLLHEHVHFTFDGDYAVARALLPKVVEALDLGPAAAPVPSRAACAELLAFTRYDELNVRAAMVRFNGRAPFLDQIDHAARQRVAEGSLQRQLAALGQQSVDGATAALRSAVARRPGDWQFRYNLANLWMEQKRYAAAVQELREVVRLMPDVEPLQTTLGEALLLAGDRAGARTAFETALRLDSSSSNARAGLARLGRTQP
jgi:tetratricopeptide (TPR) repeat protein